MTDATNGEALIQLLCELYYSAYHAGHHDTVEGQYTDVFPCDAKTYHRETVEEWLSEHQPPTASAGMVVVPWEPTEAMLDAGRTAVMARDCSGPKWGPADHFAATGFDTTGIPGHLLEGRYKMNKEWGAALVYAAMLAAHESQSPTNSDEISSKSVVEPSKTPIVYLNLSESPNADTTPDVSERGPTDNVEGE